MDLILQSDKAYATSFGNAEAGPVTFSGTIDPVAAYLTLASGDNAVSVPTGAVGVLVCPPSTNIQALTYRSVIGDTGEAIPRATPSLFLFDTALRPATIYLGAADDTTGATQVLFF